MLLRGVDRDPPGTGKNSGDIHTDVHYRFGNGNASRDPRRRTQLDPYGYFDTNRHPHRVHPTLPNAHFFTIAHSNNHANGDSNSDIFANGNADGYAYADRNITSHSHNRNLYS